MKLFAATVAVLSSTIILTVSNTAFAMPSKPYADWTEDEKTEVANELKAKSSSDCASYVQEAQQGDERATYEAAACLYGTYYLGTPNDYPNRDEYKAQFIDNARKARALNSNAPVVLSAPSE